MHEDIDRVRAERIAELNDELRRGGQGGRVYVTRGVHAQGPNFVAAALKAVRSFEVFDEDNDPYDERDFGAFEVDGRRLLFKIDYYDEELERGSPDPADPR